MLGEVGLVQKQIYTKPGYGLLAGTDSTQAGKAHVIVATTQTYIK